MKGIILASIFEERSVSTLSKQRKTEKDTYTSLVNHAIEQRDQLIADGERIESSYQKWSADTQNKAGKALKVYTKSFANLRRRWQKRYSDLEALYREHLRLEAPVEYWKTQAANYQVASNKNRTLLARLGLGGVVLFSIFFGIWLYKGVAPLNFENIQGVALFALLLTVYFYAIRITTKMYFSNQHLARDAEERSQLAYVYLAMLKDNPDAIDSEGRKLILQSLFSRVETGLLGADSSPTMPIQDIAKLFTGKKD